MKLAAIATLAFTSTMVLAQAAPTFTDAQRAKFYKAQAESVQSQAAANQMTETAQKKQQAMMSVVTELQKVCGDNFSVSMSKEGDIYCQPKTEQAEKPETPTKK